MTDENEERYVPLTERSYFSGGEPTPEKIRALATDIHARANDHSALALLSGCAISFLLEWAKWMEAEERGLNAIKVKRSYGPGLDVIADLTEKKDGDIR